MTLDQAKALINEGFAFGDVYPEVDRADKDALKEWYVRKNDLPNLVARGIKDREKTEMNGQMIAFVPTNNKAHTSRHQGYTGNICTKCGGMRMVRTGTCERCEDCGESSGGCG